jgi:hypothetical protein
VKVSTITEEKPKKEKTAKALQERLKQLLMIVSVTKSIIRVNVGL